MGPPIGSRGKLYMWTILDSPSFSRMRPAILCIFVKTESPPPRGAAARLLTPRFTQQPELAQSHSDEVSHGANGVRLPVRCLSQIGVSVSQEKTNQGLCYEPSAHRSYRHRFFVFLSALALLT